MKEVTKNKNLDNLNDFRIADDGCGEGTKTQDNSREVDGISVYFRNIEYELCRHIKNASIIIGAVAWLTNYDVLDALASVEHVSIIVQKEDFLRPDVGEPSNFKETLREKYSNLKNDFDRFDFTTRLGTMSTNGCPSIAPVRCVGNYNRKRSPSFPRMHNKFLIFAKYNDDHDSNKEWIGLKPYGVWTGSYNISLAATKSLENAVYITKKGIVDAYYNEYSQIAAISEPLDWETDWIEPEWRIGT